MARSTSRPRRRKSTAPAAGAVHAIPHHQFDTIVRNLPGVVYRCHPRGPGFAFISPGVLDLTGIPADEFTGPSRRYDALVHPDDYDRMVEQVQRATVNSGSFRIDYRLVLDGGTVIHVRDTGTVSTDPVTGEVWIDGWLFDVTAEVEAAQRLRDAVVEADRANRSKSAFLASMSHELRTPLNAIIGFTRVIGRNATSLSARDRSYLDRVGSNGEHLLGLINDLLDLSKIEAGRLELQREWTDPLSLVRDVLAALEAQAMPRGLWLRLDAPAAVGQVELDTVRFRQILINLVGNAIKFTEQGGVTVSLTASNGRLESVQVRDTGIGIPADRLEAIFAPFEQADAGTARRFGGTGLGLAISRQLCEHMDCTLTVTSRPGDGSTFSIAIPGARTRSGPARAEPSAVAA